MDRDQAWWDARTVPEPMSGCLLWLGSVNHKGYGKYGPDGAHRLAYADFVGPIPEGLFVLHHCDTPPCVQPRHLYAGTALDNMRDRLDRGRNPQKLKTHCPQGHPYSGTNLYVWRGRARYCRACMIEHRRRNREKLAILV